ncbi:MAG: CoA pyrophosphatase [Anaerolineales bacterium]|nr:CoA pyrophosphatase [Anaerolineales bacterium]MCB8992034.1 CoA pyrophosphatase [Ardenticatenaceae bacterium]
MTIDDVRRALALNEFDGLAAQRQMMPQFRAQARPKEREGQPRLGGVLALLYCYQHELHVLLTRRRDDMKAHAGQVSFPGGRREDGEPFLQTALRETEEEVGVRPSTLTILGELTPIYILPSDFEVHPFVAWRVDAKRPSFYPSVTEVAELLEVPLTHLLDPANRHEEPWNLHGFEMMVPYFEFQGHKVWGATAMMLNELLERLRAVNGH